MKQKNVKKLILDSLSDSVLNFVAYDRKEDEDLPQEVFDKAIEDGTITIDEMVDAFRASLREHLGFEEEDDPSEEHQFRIPIGDWSDDGHGVCDWFQAKASKPIEDVREAYFTAKKQLPKEVCPESFCHDYGDGTPPEKTLATLAKLGFKPTEETDFNTRSMAEVVVWFLNQGDPDLHAELLPESDDPHTLTFFGHDKKKRHIGHIGYGLHAQ